MDNVYTVHIQHSDVFGVPPFSSTKECVNNGAGDEIQSRSFFNRLITIEYSRDPLNCQLEQQTVGLRYTFCYNNFKFINPKKLSRKEKQKNKLITSYR